MGIREIRVSHSVRFAGCSIFQVDCMGACRYNAVTRNGRCVEAVLDGHLQRDGGGVFTLMIRDGKGPMGSGA